MRALVVVLAPAVWALLQGAFPATPYAPERGYCVTDWQRRGDTLFVRAAEPASDRHGTPLSVQFSCGEGTLPMHTHPLARCTVTGWYCESAPSLPCAPSPADSLLDLWSGGVVACRDGRAAGHLPEGM